MKDLRDIGGQMKALDYMADKNNGHIKVNFAKRLFIEAGLSKAKVENLYSQIYALMNDSPHYELFEPGEFKRKP